MFMRYRGDGVGHKSIREATQCLLDDRNKLDSQPFTLECDHKSSTENGEDSDNSDIPMDNLNSSDPEEGRTSDDDGSEMDVDPRDAQQLVDDELGD